jgi:hypothetical protein
MSCSLQILAGRFQNGIYTIRSFTHFRLSSKKRSFTHLTPTTEQVFTDTIPNVTVVDTVGKIAADYNNYPHK